jgi:hypothetical protein
MPEMSSERDFGLKPDDQDAIDWLRPGSREHAFVLQYLKDRIGYSERSMSPFHSRWRNNELMLQAYVGLKDFEGLLKDTEDQRGNPGIGEEPVAINVPFAWATVNTIVTYLLHMFGGRRPIFPISTYRGEQVTRAQNMEMYCQYNADVVKFIRALYFFLMDGETYGLAVIRTMWREDRKKRFMIVPPSAELQSVMDTLGMTAQGERQEQEYISFQGNSAANVDPFMFFPDPRVPMHEVNEKGEWVVWRAFMGKHQLLKEQAAGFLKHVDKISNEDWNRDATSVGSARGMRALGTNAHFDRDSRVAPNYQVDQGTFEVVPKDLGLGDSEVPEKWLFTIVNGRQIVQAEPIDLPHGKHPVIVVEPNSVGYSFGQLSTVDMLGPMQEMMSWFMNSHIYNVRSALNNMLIVDPTKVEMQDLKTPGPGKLIRLKNTAFGLGDPKNAVQQLAVTDVTRSHIADFQMFGRMAADMTGATDNVRGLQDAGGRKTATEIRTSSEAGTSRLAAKGKIYSSQGFTTLAEMWTINAQNFLTEDFELSVLGEQASGQDSLRITPDSIQGDFLFPVHDGSLPMDKIGMLDVWREIFQAVLGDQQLRSGYDLFSMFDWIAQLGGAQNIKSFRMNVVPQTQQQQMIGSGQGVPLDAAAAGLGMPGMM